MTAVLMVVVALPGLAAGIRAAHQGWTPTNDDGFLITRAFDVFSRHSPLVGQYSMAGERGSAAAHSLGPIPYWLIAGPLRVLPVWTLPIWMAVVSGACLSTSVWLSRRRAGLGFAWATAVGLLLLTRALGPEALAAVWNPWAGLAPMILLAFLAWSIADGERWLLPIAVVAASYSMQSHLTYVVPALVLLVVGCAWAYASPVIDRWRRRSDSDADAPDPFEAPTQQRRRLDLRNRPVVQAIIAGVVCWVLPLVQQATHDPGNMRLVADAGSADRQAAGATAVQAAVGRVLGGPPTFLRSVPATGEAVVEGIKAAPAAGFAIGVIVIACLLALGAWALKRRDRTVATGVSVACGLIVGMSIVAASMPLERAIAVPYTFRWFGIAGLFAWLMCGLGVTRVLSARRAPVAAVRHGRVRDGALAVVLALVLLAPLLDHGPSDSWSYRPADTLGDALIDHTEPGGRYLMARSGLFDVSLAPAMAWRLREAGRSPVLAGNAADAFGDQYAQTGAACDGAVVLLGPDDQAAEGSRLLATADTTGGPGVPATVRLYLEPADGGVNRC